jgi:hypothetical protein
MVQHKFGFHANKSINHLDKHVLLKQMLKYLTVKVGVRWKRLQEWPKAKAASHSAEWSFVYGELRTSMLPVPVFVACGRNCLSLALGMDDLL